MKVICAHSLFQIPHQSLHDDSTESIAKHIIICCMYVSLNTLHLSFLAALLTRPVPHSLLFIYLGDHLLLHLLSHPPLLLFLGAKNSEREPETKNQTTKRWIFGWISKYLNAIAFLFLKEIRGMIWWSSHCVLFNYCVTSLLVSHSSSHASIHLTQINTKLISHQQPETLSNA